MTTINNIFPSQQQQNSRTIQSSRYSPYQSLVDTNRLKLKTIQAQYFQNQYKNILTVKQKQKQLQRLQRQKDRQLIEAKKIAYQQQLQRQIEKKQMEKVYLSSDYKSTIDTQQQKNRYQKQLNKIVQNQVLSSPTWIRDAQSQRQANLRKKLYYSKALQEHVKLQQLRKLQQQQTDKYYQQKVNRQADQALQKQFNQMEAKYRQKSMFQQRQNELLGIQTQGPNLQQSRTYLQKQRQLKMTERQIYRQGLQAQYQKQQQQKYQRRRAFSQQKQDFNPRYNPITNPIPFVYKNPNVLRMLNQPF